MSSQTLQMTPALSEYLLRGAGESAAARSLREETQRELGRWSAMQVSPEQGAFMALLIKLTGTRRAIEVGTFTGYSALRVAEALPADGRLVACDVSAEWTAIGRRHWAAAGVADKIDLKLAPAVETLDTLIAQGESDAFDFAFIDADKENYDAYYERCLTLLRPGGTLAIDNVLWGGRVVDAEHTDAATVAIRALNEKAREDGRVQAAMLPIGDGLTLAVKR